MKLCLLGYGKMGKAIDNLSKRHEIDILYRITSDNYNLLSEALANVDMVIEFTKPDSAISNIKACIDHGVPVVCGTTGWLDSLPELSSYVQNHDGSLLYASNFSLGVNLFFNLNRKLAKMMSAFDSYHCSVEESHHLQKLDKPSGTAISIAQQIIDNHTAYQQYTIDDPKQTDALYINVLREVDVIGTHRVQYQSPIDHIFIEHKAYNRDGFAEGAILASKWLLGKKGVFTMDDFLNLD